ncbi:uncharacterized protein [Penaeus vannamei]|uniref:uncharacterized protein n=1 Tax=Penaeus vannamei TaxID=6689 RepID=UPI00387F3DB6
MANVLSVRRVTGLSRRPVYIGSSVRPTDNQGQFLCPATNIAKAEILLLFFIIDVIATAALYFQWAVDHDDSGNDFGHQEARDGDHTQGSYYVQLPDGRLQTVKYFVDGDSGYVAEVSYEGEARYDSVESRETSRARPRFSAPAPRFDSRESRERPAPTPFRPRHFDSRESLEIPRRRFDSREFLEDISRQHGY